MQQLPQRRRIDPSFQEPFSGAAFAHKRAARAAHTHFSRPSFRGLVMGLGLEIPFGWNLASYYLPRLTAQLPFS